MIALAAPSVGTLVRPAADPAFLVLCLLLGGGYTALVLARDRRHPGGRWPAGRTWAFGGGVAVLAVATQSGLGRYDTVLFSLHVVQHLLLGMVAPLLLALGAPVTLALQGLPRAGQVALLRVLTHPVARVLTHPVVAWASFSLSLFALYFTPLLDLSLRHDLVHTAVHLHFVASGFLFCWAVLGADVGRHHPSHAARLLAVALTIPLHALLGLALTVGADRPLGAGTYGAIERAWGGTPAADQRTGAAVLWGVGELWGLVLVIVVAASWMRSDVRRQAREDDARDRAGRQGREPVSADGEEPRSADEDVSAPSGEDRPWS